VRWNVISFVNLDHSDNFHTPASFANKGPIGANGAQEGGVDIKPFLDFASSLGAQCTTDLPFTFVNPPTPQETKVCVEQNWWLTSVQAGFEIWHLDSAGQLSANTFSVTPIGFSNQPHVNPVHTDPFGAQYTDLTTNTPRRVGGHRPVVGENGLYVVQAAGCPNGTDASIWLSTNRSNVDNADFAASQPMTESPPGSGHYVGTQSLGLESSTRAAGAGSVLFRVNCPDGTQWAGNGAIYASDIADVMWLHKPSGTLLEWQIDRDANTVATPTLGWSCGPDCQAQWKVVGSGDLNGDDRADLLWYNASSGQLGPWLIGTASPYSVTGPLVNRTRVSNANDPWRVVGVADLNGDGYNDVLWHNVKTGVLQEWFLDGANKVTGDRNVDWTCSTACSNSWLAVGLGDFNADGHVDILWRDRDDDLVGTWNLDATGHVLTNPLLPQCQCGGTWEVGVGDANGDGFSDLYWFNPASGVVTTWLLDQYGNRGSVHTLNSTCPPAGCSDEWEPVAVNEFNLQGQVPND
jgi:hypothetical protein